jgi:hypothetical protein
MTDEQKEPVSVFDLAASVTTLRDARAKLDKTHTWALEQLLLRPRGAFGLVPAASIFEPTRGIFRLADGSTYPIDDQSAVYVEARQRHVHTMVTFAREQYEGALADYREALRQHEKKEADAFAASVKKLSEEQVEAAKSQVTAANALNAHTDGLKNYTRALVVVGVAQFIAAAVMAVAAWKGH